MSDGNPFLLDTHAFLWWIFDAPLLPESARAVIRNPAHRILVSAASAWEISTKHRLGKLPAASELIKDIPGWVRRAGFEELPVRLSHAQRAGSWPLDHRDPFDRMLAAQSAIERAPLLTRDRALSPFGIDIIW